MLAEKRGSNQEWCGVMLLRSGISEKDENNEKEKQVANKAE